MGKKMFAIGLALIMCLGILTACVDYYYEYNYSVVGENGSISVEVESYGESFVRRRGTKRGAPPVEFTATPKGGYRVKEWTFNEEIVEGNKSNSFIANVKGKQYKNYITVEFEPIS